MIHKGSVANQIPSFKFSEKNDDDLNNLVLESSGNGSCSLVIDLNKRFSYYAPSPITKFVFFFRAYWNRKLKGNDIVHWDGTSAFGLSFNSNIPSSGITPNQFFGFYNKVNAQEKNNNFVCDGQKLIGKPIKIPEGKRDGDLFTGLWVIEKLNDKVLVSVGENHDGLSNLQDALDSKNTKYHLYKEELPNTSVWYEDHSLNCPTHLIMKNPSSIAGTKKILKEYLIRLFR